MIAPLLVSVIAKGDQWDIGLIRRLTHAHGQPAAPMNLR